MSDKFKSTLLAQNNDPLEIQKADLDLLKKINEVQINVESLYRPEGITLTTFQPLTSVAASGANVTYTLPFAVGERKAYIPQAYLKTAGNAGTLTITTGSGTPLVIPLSASTDTITSGDALIPVYIAPDGSVVAESWSISGSNTNGSYVKYGDGTMEQWGSQGGSIGSSTSPSSAIIYAGTLPVSYVGSASVSINATENNAIGGARYEVYSAYSTGTIWRCAIANNYSSTLGLLINWMTIGRWK